MEDKLTVLSLGAGVQSSTVALMSHLGDLPKVDAAVFADTGDEPQAVYNYLKYVTDIVDFPVVIAKNETSLSEHVKSSIQEKRRASKPPLFTKGEAGKSPGMLTRYCTSDFKIAPIQRAVRKLMKESGHKHVEQWIGISLDEVQRMKPSRVKYSTHRWPLIEKRMTRHDCFLWMESHGFKRPPRSACTFCPYRSNREWLRIKQDDPKSWAEAVKFDAMVRTGIHKVRAECFVHRDCVPLDEVYLEADRDQLDLFNGECEGMCGV